jgi:hypothetical protein
MILLLPRREIDLLIHKLDSEKGKTVNQKVRQKIPQKAATFEYIGHLRRMEYAKNREAVSVYFSLFISLQMRVESDLLSCFLNEKKLP